MPKRAVLLIAVMVLMLLACKASETGNLVSSHFLCVMTGGTWVEEKGIFSPIEYCRQETDTQSDSSASPEVLDGSPGDDASVADLPVQPPEQSNLIIPTVEPENSEVLSLEECDGRPYIEITPVITQDENDCASGYHLMVTNKDASDALVIIPHFSILTEKNSENAWYPDLADRIDPGVSITDAGKGFIFEKWGGFYSTCQMRDGELSFPVHSFTDRIAARKALDGCVWIIGESDLDLLSIQLPNYVEE